MAWKKLKNLTCLVENDGEVTIGRYDPVRCAASACDEDSQLAVLVKRDIETIDDLIERLDAAVDRAWEHEIYTDEING
jgi:hypothetical protein